MCGAQFGAGFDAEFVNKPGTDVGEQLQRCSLFAVAVEGEHESGVQSLVQGFVHSQRPQVLACQLSPTKTLITHAASQAARGPEPRSRRRLRTLTSITRSGTACTSTRYLGDPSIAAIGRASMGTRGLLLP